MIPRALAMLSLVPPAPGAITAQALAAELSARGMTVTPRTVQRDLVDLAALVSIVASAERKPFGWSWVAGSSCPCCGGVR